MSNSPSRLRPFTTRLRSTAHAGALAFMATLLGAPVQAGVNDYPIPANPLSMGVPLPPNVMLIMDDHPSLESLLIYPDPDFIQQVLLRIETPPDTQGRTVFITRGSTAARLFPTFNSLAYDPRVEYKPWKQHNGQYYPDMDPAQTSFHRSLAVATDDAVANAELQGQRISLYNPPDGTAYKTWFYVPKHGITDITDLSQYTAYKLVGATQAEQCKTAVQDAQGRWMDMPVPEQGTLLPGQRLWPGQDCRPVSSFTWTTPQGTTITRSLAQEWQNYANWAGYHRNHIKMLKARLSYLFAELDDNYRIGHMAIQQPSKDWWIPVQTQGGLFKGENRRQLFDRILATRLGNYGVAEGRAFQKALEHAGEYFRRTDKDGPWGPEAPGQQLACRQNFTLLAIGEKASLALTATGTNVGNQDGTAGDVITAPDGSTYQYQPTRPYQDQWSNTLADVAMKYWKQDLRPDLDNTVPTTAENPAFWQHMVTMVVSTEQYYAARNPAQYLPAWTDGSKSWMDPIWEPHDRFNAQADDLFHATLNSRGTTISATDPDALSQALATTLSAIRQRAGAAANLSFNGATLKAGGYSYVPSYVSGKWTGELSAYPVTATGIGTTPLWRASEKIPAFGSTRRLLTHGNPGQSGALAMKAFPTITQQTALGTDVTNWIRGDRSREGTSLRTREHLLGDIVHSTPQYVRTPNAHAVLVGANDGMLHMFDADSGQERFAYLPGLLDLDKLKQNSRKDDFVHQYFVDGQIAARPTGNGNDVIAVGSLGRGGYGVFGLKFDLAGGFAPSPGLTSWEFAGDRDMGLVLGQPQIHKVSGYTGADGNQLSVLVPNGINSPNGKALVYILNATTGAVQKKILLGQQGDDNGLINLTAVSSKRDGVVDTLYAGDMRGNVWRVSDTTGNGNWSAVNVFTATDEDGNRQPITGNISVVFDESAMKHLNSTQGDSITHFYPSLVFGTGSYLTAADQTSRATQSWYMIRDNGNGVAATKRQDLQKRRFASQQMVNGKTVRTIEAVPGTGSLTAGWVLDLVLPDGTGEGERMIGEQLIVGNTLVASSMVPTGGDCGGQGRGYLNAVDLFSGMTTNVMFDLNGDGKVDDQDQVGGKPPSSIDLGVGAISNPGLLLGQLPGAGTGQQSMLCVNSATGQATCLGIANAWGPQYGRVNWREIALN